MADCALLARPPKSAIGDVIRATEPDLALVPCPDCVIHPGCALSGLLDEALVAFMTVLDQRTIRGSGQ